MRTGYRYMVGGIPPAIPPLVVTGLGTAKSKCGQFEITVRSCPCV